MPWTIEAIKDANRDAGRHFFDPPTMRAFKTRVYSAVYEGPGGIYFVTRDLIDYGPPRLKEDSVAAKKCWRCGGSGKTLLHVDNSNNPKTLSYGQCPECKGTGGGRPDERRAYGFKVRQFDPKTGAVWSIFEPAFGDLSKAKLRARAKAEGAAE